MTRCTAREEHGRRKVGRFKLSLSKKKKKPQFSITNCLRKNENPIEEKEKRAIRSIGGESGMHNIIEAREKRHFKEDNIIVKESKAIGSIIGRNI